MRYSDLHIETYRHAPARARTEGEALLIRAGYVQHEGGLTPLGRRAVARLEELAQAHPSSQVFSLLKLPVIQTAALEYYFAGEQGQSEVLQCPLCGYAETVPLAVFRK